jgi:hypothetical protein
MATVPKTNGNGNGNGVDRSASWYIQIIQTVLNKNGIIGVLVLVFVGFGIWGGAILGSHLLEQNADITKANLKASEVMSEAVKADQANQIANQEFQRAMLAQQKELLSTQKQLAANGEKQTTAISEFKMATNQLAENTSLIARNEARMCDTMDKLDASIKEVGVEVKKNVEVLEGVLTFEEGVNRHHGEEKASRDKETQDHKTIIDSNAIIMDTVETIKEAVVKP